MLQDAGGRSSASVRAEVPSGRIWCPLDGETPAGLARLSLFAHNKQNVDAREQPVITVVGKAFYDVDHAPRNQTNHRNNMPSFAVWEIHPVDATDGFPMKYWEIIADNLSKAGWRWGCVSGVDCNGRTIFAVDAHRGDGKRFVVRAG